MDKGFRDNGLIKIFQVFYVDCLAIKPQKVEEGLVFWSNYCLDFESRKESKNAEDFIFLDDST